MFDPLEAAIRDLEIPVHGDALAAVLRLRDRLDAVVATAAGQYDRAGLWEVEGATSMIACCATWAGSPGRRR